MPIVTRAYLIMIWAVTQDLRFTQKAVLLTTSLILQNKTMFHNNFLHMTPNPKPDFHRLKGAKLKAQNEAIIIRDGNLCGVCRQAPPDGNHFAIHHNLYPQRADIMDEKLSVCPECHANLHEHIVYEDFTFVHLYSKRATQEWVRERIKQIERGEI